MIAVRCPKCQAVLVVDNTQAGSRKPCPACQEPIDIPSAGATPTWAGPPPLREQDIPDLAPRSASAAGARVGWVQRLLNVGLPMQVALLVLVVGLPVGGLVGYQYMSHSWDSSPVPPTPTPVPTAPAERLRPQANTAIARVIQAADWSARQSAVEALCDLGTDALPTVLTVLQSGHGLDQFNRRLELNDTHRSDLLTALLRWSRQGRISPAVNPVAASLLGRDATRQAAALLLAYQGDDRAAGLLAAELARLTRRDTLVSTRLTANLEAQRQAAEQFLADDDQAIQVLRAALIRLGPAAWPALLAQYWPAWAWIGSQQGDRWLSELDQIRTSPFTSQATLTTALGALARSGPADAALPAAVYLTRSGDLSYDRRRELAGWVSGFLADPDPAVVQRTVWVIARLTGQQFHKFDANQLPAQAGPAAVAACRAWITENLGAVKPRS